MPNSLLLIKRVTRLVILAFVSLCLTHCRPAPNKLGDQSSGSDSHFTLRGSYGTLAYEGTAVRTEEQGRCVIRISILRLTFDPRATTNRTDRIDATQLRLVATKKPASGDGPWCSVAQAEHPLSVSLTPESPSTTITDITLSVPADSVCRADHLGLGVTDGKLLWPLGCELKAQ